MRDADEPHSSHDFGKDVIPYIVPRYRVCAHRFADIVLGRSSGAFMERYKDCVLYMPLAVQGVTIGLLTVYSATSVPGAHEGLWVKQLLWFGVAAIGFALLPSIILTPLAPLLIAGGFAFSLGAYLAGRFRVSALRVIRREERHGAFHD